MADDKLVISIELDDGTVKSGFLRLEKQAEEATNNIGGFFRRAGEVAVGIGLERAFSSLFTTIKEGFFESIKAAEEQENAINKLANSLATAGSFSKDALDGFVQLADEIQRTTTIQDDAALSLFAYARNFTRTNEQAKELGKAAIDLSAQLGIDLNSAAQQIGATFSGVVPRALTRTVAGLKELSASQLQAGEGLRLIAERFKGAGENEALTFAGAITQVKNSVNSFLAELGSAFTKSQSIQSVIRFIKQNILSLTEGLNTFKASNGDIFRPILESAIALGQVLNTYVIVPFQITYNGIKIIIDSLAQLVFGFLSDLSGFAGKIITTFSPNSPLGQKMLAFRDFSSDMFKDLGKNAQEAAANIDSAFSGNLVSKTLNGLNAAVINSANTYVSSMDRIKNSTIDTQLTVNDSIFKTIEPIQNLSGEINSVGESFALFTDNFQNAAFIFANDAKKQFADAGSAAFRALANGVGSGMAAIGKALVKGEDIFQAFAGAMLAALGQAAIQLGSTYILVGLARLFASYGADATGYQLIGIGSAMAVAGGALLAVSQGGGQSTPNYSTSAGGGASGVPTTPGLSESTEVDSKAQQRVVVNISGDVLDSRETSLRIVELINSAVNDQGAVITARA